MYEEPLLAAAERHDTLNLREALEVGRLLRRLDALHEQTAGKRNRTRVARLIDIHGTVAAAEAALQNDIAAAQGELDALAATDASLKAEEGDLRSYIKTISTEMIIALSGSEYDIKRHRAALDAARIRRDKAVAILVDAGMSESRAKATAKPARSDLDALTAEIAAAEARAVAARKSMGSIAAQVRAVIARTPAALPEAA